MLHVEVEWMFFSSTGEAGTRDGVRVFGSEGKGLSFEEWENDDEDFQVGKPLLSGLSSNTLVLSNALEPP